MKRARFHEARFRETAGFIVLTTAERRAWKNRAVSPLVKREHAIRPKSGDAIVPFS